jgi:hypothetical protein
MKEWQVVSRFEFSVIQIRLLFHVRQLADMSLLLLNQVLDDVAAGWI